MMSDDDMSDESYPLVSLNYLYLRTTYQLPLSLPSLCLPVQEYSDSEEEPDVDLENQYYNSKALKEEDSVAALSSFEQVLDLEEEKGEWGFKALKQMMKLHFKLVRIGS